MLASRRPRMTYCQQQLQYLQARLYPQPEIGVRLRRARQLIDQQFAEPLLFMDSCIGSLLSYLEVAVT
jgi:hypothetical protein